jgi:hypothetical protein
MKQAKEEMTMDKNKYYEKRTKIGNAMYSFLQKSTKALIKYRWLYWLLNFTWGILTTLCGLIISLVMLCIGKKPKRWCSIWYFQICDNWGGLEMGTMFLRDNSNYIISTNNHEYGHTFQNAILGPFFIFIVAIPSAIRYWYRKFSKKTQPDYDTIWFEGSATDIGNDVYSFDIQKEEN